MYQCAAVDQLQSVALGLSYSYGLDVQAGSCLERSRRSIRSKEAMCEGFTFFFERREQPLTLFSSESVKSSSLPLPPLRATARMLELPAAVVLALLDCPIEGLAPPPCVEVLGEAPPPTRSGTTPLLVPSTPTTLLVSLAVAATAALATPDNVGCLAMKAVVAVSLLLAGDISSQGRLGRAARLQTPLDVLLSGDVAPFLVPLPTCVGDAPPRAVPSKSDPEG